MPFESLPRRSSGSKLADRRTARPNGYGRRAGRAVPIALCAGVTAFVTSQAHAAYSCAVTPTDILFGTVAPLQPSAIDSTGTVTVVCTPAGKGAEQVSYTISFSAGISGDVTNRQMASGASRLNYNLYRDSAHAQVWGDAASGEGVTGSYKLSSGGAPASLSYTAYGRIPGPQANAVPGLYQDTITVRVDF